jgi:hypothetical protein
MKSVLRQQEMLDISVPALMYSLQLTTAKTPLLYALVQTSIREGAMNGDSNIIEHAWFFAVAEDITSESLGKPMTNIGGRSAAFLKLRRPARRWWRFAAAEHGS